MTILAATDLSEHSRDAVRWAAALAAQRNEPLLVAHVIDSLGDDELWTALFETPDEIERRVLESATERVSAFTAEALAGHSTPDKRSVLVSVGPPAEEIDRFSKQKKAELLVTGTTGHGRLRNAVFGSTAHRLTHTSKRPTIFVPEGAAPPPAKRIIVALDFSECSDAALEWAAKVSKEWGSEIVAVHGVGVSALSPDYEPSANFIPMVEAITEERERLIRERLEGHGVEGRIIVSRSAPAEAILDAADSENADLIVMGTHGRGVLKRFFLGSVALRVLRDPPCAVATIHTPPSE